MFGVFSELTFLASWLFGQLTFWRLTISPSIVKREGLLKIIFLPRFELVRLSDIGRPRKLKISNYLESRYDIGLFVMIVIQLNQLHLTSKLVSHQLPTGRKIKEDDIWSAKKFSKIYSSFTFSYNWFDPAQMKEMFLNVLTNKINI